MEWRTALKILCRADERVETEKRAQLFLHHTFRPNNNYLIKQ